MDKLTQRQQKILNLIQDWLERHGAPPTRAEIAQQMGFRSASAAEDHLRALARKGYLELAKGRNRNIRLLQTGVKLGAGIPLIGQVAAGSPLLALENIDNYYDCANLFQPPADYLLRVSGDSMIDAGINDGNLLAVHRQADASDGEIVVARIDDEVTVKIFRENHGCIRLVPANAAYKAIEPDPQQHTLSIEGVVVGIIRHRLGHGLARTSL